MGPAATLVMYLLSTAMACPRLFLSLVIHEQRFSANDVQLVGMC